MLRGEDRELFAALRRDLVDGPVSVGTGSIRCELEKPFFAHLVQVHALGPVGPDTTVELVDPSHRVRGTLAPLKKYERCSREDVVATPVEDPGKRRGAEHGENREYEQ